MKFNVDKYIKRFSSFFSVVSLDGEELYVMYARHIQHVSMEIVQYQVHVIVSMDGVVSFAIRI